MQDRKVKYTTVPLGGGGLVPNMLSGNVDAVVLYSPLSFKIMQEKQGRSLIDFGAEVQPHLSGLWIAPDKFIQDKPQVVQKAMNALFGAVVFLQDKANRAEAVKLIAEIDEIAPQVAEAELDGNLAKMSTTGELREDWLGPRARPRPAGRHDRSGAGGRDLRRQVQARADEEIADAMNFARMLRPFSLGRRCPGR